MEINLIADPKTRAIVEKIEPDIRRLKHITTVCHDQEWIKRADPELVLYYMYRGKPDANRIRYDITVIPSLMIGDEFNKTWGHYHVDKCRELYTVLEGEAIWFMQRRASGNDAKISDVYFVGAKPGQGIIIPGGYAHFTINPANTSLVIANWVSTEYVFDYKTVDKMKGACYYYLKSGWTKNSRYEEIAELRKEQPLAKIPQNFDFLR